jgi:hypothetical protein
MDGGCKPKLGRETVLTSIFVLSEIFQQCPTEDVVWRRSKEGSSGKEGSNAHNFLLFAHSN